MKKARTPEEALALVLQRVESTLNQVTREDIFPHAAPSDRARNGSRPAGPF